MCTPGVANGSVVEHEGHHQGGAVLDDLAILDGGVLLQHLQPCDVAQRLVGALHRIADSVFPAVRRSADDLCLSCNRHVLSYSSRKIIFRSTRYSTILPLATLTRLPSTSTPVRPRSVFL